MFRDKLMQRTNRFSPADLTRFVTRIPWSAAGCLSVVMLATVMVAATVVPPEPQALARARTSAGRAEFIHTYCLDCHNARLKTAGLVLENVATDDLNDRATVWEKVIKRLGAEEMPPPAAARRPHPALSSAFRDSVIADLDAAARKHPFAGRTVIRRLNRTEYGNAVRDLLHLDFFAYAGDLPQDGSADGFDNIADSLSMSPVLLESYLKVGRKVSLLAIGEGDASPITERFPATKSQSAWQGEGMPFGTRGGILVRKYFPRDGEYDLRAVLNNPDLTPAEGVRFFHIRVPVTTGAHTFIVTFPQTLTEREGPVPNLNGAGGRALGGPVDPQGSATRPTVLFLLDGRKLKEFAIAGPSVSESAFGARPGPPTVVRAEVSGPYHSGAPADTPSRKHIFICKPGNSSEEPVCAGKILTALLRRAWRRDVSPADVQPFQAAFAGYRRKNSFDVAIATALRDILVSPAFLFRLEFDPREAKPGQVYRVNHFDLASRLSFFLWSSIPDDRLLAVAAKGQLHTPSVLEGEARRMLSDARADSLMENFAGQSLGLADADHFQPDAKTYPEFDEGLRDAFKTEMRLFLRSIMREDRSVMDVINARYTFVDERLAALYGIPGVKGPGFRRVTLPADSPRGGVLGMGLVLMPTSHTAKTSPVYRGKWILANLLGSPPSPPPAGVPPLDIAPVNGRVLTTREQVERHRTNPACASCHARMDPYGFSLENFDVIGRWRERDDGGAIDATATLANGRSFTGPGGLRKLLCENPEIFAGAMTARMMTYALGRSVEPGDMPAIRGILRAAAPDYKFDDIVLGVIRSTPFQMKTAEGGSHD